MNSIRSMALGLLMVARLLSSGINIVHDCDEVYNYWEPLHYLIHSSGMQTWEYRYAPVHTIALCKLRHFCNACWHPASALKPVQLSTCNYNTLANDARLSALPSCISF